MAGVTTEALFCHPLAFGAGMAAANAEASPVQRAICRAADGLPLKELADDPAVIRSFGGEDAIACLPHEPPKELFCVCCIRGGKSLLAGCLAFKIAFTLDLSFMAKGEVARVSVVSVDKDKAGAVMGHLMNALTLEGGLLGRYLVKKPTPTPERVRIRRPDGRIVEIVVAAGKRAGSSLVSRWTVACVFDEACRMTGSGSDGVVNFADMRSSVIGRLSLVPGAQLIVVSSPWAASGPVYDAVQQHHGRPTKYLIVVRAPGPDMTPAIWTPEVVEAMRGDPSKEQEFLCDAMGEFADVESGWLMADDIKRGVGKRAVVDLPRSAEWFYTAAMDPGLRGNSWTLVIVGYRPSENGDATGDRYSVARCCQWTGTKKNPLDVRSTLTDVRDELRVYGISEAWTDGWGADFIRQIGADVKVDVKEDDETTAAKDERPVDFRSKLIARQVELSPEPQLRADMLAARLRRTANGCKLELPLTRDGRHCDYVPALLLAMAKAATGPSNLDRLSAWRAKNGGIVVY